MKKLFISQVLRVIQWNETEYGAIYEGLGLPSCPKNRTFTEKSGRVNLPLAL